MHLCQHLAAHTESTKTFRGKSQAEGLWEGNARWYFSPFEIVLKCSVCLKIKTVCYRARNINGRICGWTSGFQFLSHLVQKADTRVIESLPNSATIFTGFVVLMFSKRSALGCSNIVVSFCNSTAFKQNPSLAVFLFPLGFLLSLQFDCICLKLHSQNIDNHVSSVWKIGIVVGLWLTSSTHFFLSGFVASTQAG